MKHLILISTSIVSISSMVAMEPQTPKLRMRNNDYNTLYKPYIIIINQLPADKNYVPNSRIDISDEIRIDYQNNKPWAPDKSTIQLNPNEGIRFAPHTYKTLPENERLGMNDAGDSAHINMYVHAAVRNQLMKIYIGKYSPIQFGDTIRISAAPCEDDTIIIKHNDNKKPLKKIETIYVVETLGYPKKKSEELVKQNF
jgi:hypothetical protein